MADGDRDWEQQAGNDEVLRGPSSTRLRGPPAGSSSGFGRLSDADLLARSRSDGRAFAVFYDRWEAAIAAYFVRRTRDPELTADLTAEVFAAALAASGRYRPQTPNAAAWLFAIAHNKLVKAVRRGHVEARARRRLGIRDATALSDDAYERLESMLDPDGAAAMQLLADLPAPQREAVQAYVLDEHTYPEIAQALETSELVVRKRVSRGLAHLRAQLEKTQ